MIFESQGGGQYPPNGFLKEREPYGGWAQSEHQSGPDWFVKAAGGGYFFGVRVDHF